MAYLNVTTNLFKYRHCPGKFQPAANIRDNYGCNCFLHGVKFETKFCSLNASFGGV